MNTQNFCQQHFRGRYRYVSFEDQYVLNLYEQNVELFFRTYSGYIFFDSCHRVERFVEALVRYCSPGSMYFGRFIICGRTRNFFDHQKWLNHQNIKAKFSEIMDVTYELANTGADTSQQPGEVLLNRVVKDVVVLANIQASRHVRMLVKMLAKYVGVPVNFSELARQVGVSVPSVIRWADYLAELKVIFFVHAELKISHGRQVKSPKIYFYQHDFYEYLLGCEVDFHDDQVNFVHKLVCDLYKRCEHLGYQDALSYFKNSNGLHVDVIIRKKEQRYLINFDSSQAFKRKHLQSLVKLCDEEDIGFIVYRGESKQLSDDIYAICENEFILA